MTPCCHTDYKLSILPAHSQRQAGNNGSGASEEPTQETWGFTWSIDCRHFWVSHGAGLRNTLCSPSVRADFMRATVNKVFATYIQIWPTDLCAFNWMWLFTAKDIIWIVPLLLLRFPFILHVDKTIAKFQQGAVSVVFENLFDSLFQGEQGGLFLSYVDQSLFASWWHWQWQSLWDYSETLHVVSLCNASLLSKRATVNYLWSSAKNGFN